jgi:hypothetical protein
VSRNVDSKSFGLHLFIVHRNTSGVPTDKLIYYNRVQSAVLLVCAVRVGGV